MFNPIEASQNIKDEFSGYISTSFHLADKDYAEQFREALSEEGTIAKGPYLSIDDSFKSGKSLEDLIVSGEVSPLIRLLEGNIADGDKEIKINRNLYLHQQKAVEKANSGKNLVVTTGTGSGKTECFIIPILNHLLKEKEAGSLNDGVRAILIYPMNALANDQMKRLRATLKSYPDITFGVYNSNTKYNDADGIEEFGRIFKDENGNALKPLPNEIISRESMQQRPPHILITNYAMLEYMLLRPNDDKVFSGSKLRFLVLDEAHIYRGATGIETSLLLRRLKARISEPSKVLHILTSATLGGKEADSDIVTFANRLCEAEFSEEDIIRSETQRPEWTDEEIEVPLSIFEEMANPEDSLNNILDKYNVTYDSSKSDPEIIYDFCVRSKAYRVLRECASKPYTVEELARLMSEFIEVDEDNVVNIINVAVKAEKNKTALIKARYHMFARALEGAYITLKPTKKLFLKRNSLYTIGQDSWKVFEACVCDDCGRVGIVGKSNGDRLEFASNRFDDESEYFLLAEQGEEFIDDDDEVVEEIGKNDYLICPKCGEIHHKSLVYDFKCEHDKSKLVNIIESERKGTKNEPKCPCCNFGHMKSFYLGYDAATAVLGTALFEQLPESEVKLESRVNSSVASSNLFASVVAQSNPLEVIKKKRQFLSFSDSRGEAAYYACYMTSFYEEFLRRRGIWNVVKANVRDMCDHPWEISTLISELTSYFDSNRTFALPGDKGVENLTPISKRQAWIAVLNEMVNARRSTSLVSLGILNFEYKGNSGPIMSAVAQRYNQNVEDMVALFNLLVMDIVYSGAIKGDISLSDEDNEYIYYTTKDRMFTKCKENRPEKNQNYLSGWIPRTRTNGSMYRNGRVVRVARSLNISEMDAKSLLEDYWNAVLVGSEYGLTPAGDSEYFISTDKFVVSCGAGNRPIYLCEKCGKTTMFSDKEMCISVKCDGRLKRIVHDELIKDNHFAKLYSSDMMKPLHIKEHTAQLGRAEQQAYQEMFVKKDINALSCSTTFEMGVDVGDLETVYLRNMPPSPSNYVQRAGRAGRSIHAAAYTLTYAKLSSHDFTYFDKPERMISGKIGVPLFSIENEKVVARHMYAIALSAFFKENEDVYNKNNADIFLNQDGYERFVSFLDSKPTELKGILLASIPTSLHERMGLSDFSWTDKLIGNDGVLAIAVAEFRNIVEYYETEFNRLKDTDIEAAARCLKNLKDFRKSKDDKTRSSNELIEFLVRNNVLPKYGFPVDTVELYQNTTSEQEKKLQMVRDLQLAIAEYAPDSQVVADGKLFTSRYIRKLPQTTGKDWEEVYIAQCRNKSCLTWNYRITEPSIEGEKCISCQNIIEKARWKKAIEPRKGFVADAEVKDVPLKKPDRTFRSEDYYIGDQLRLVMNKKTFMINGVSKIQMETSSNDSLMVVCKDDFFVCERCGYAISSISGNEDKDFNSYAASYTKKHTSARSVECKGKLYKRELCHAFKTDVVKLVFGTSRANNKPTMLSVMYALLEALSEVLDIERTDIKGCLHKVRYEDHMVWSIILYDAVAGGAGHVRRLVTDDGDVFQQIVNKAIEITKGCSCSPSCYNCLRNYYNQSIHDLLSREAAYTVLEEFVGDVVTIPDDTFEVRRERPNSRVSENDMSFTGSVPCEAYTNWSEFKTMIPDELQDMFVDYDRYMIPIPTEAYCDCRINGTNEEFQAMLLWREQKIMLFYDAESKVDVSGWTVLCPEEISIAEFALLFR